MSPVKQQRARASKPKVRTGCKTCKIRRVKCDESKPYCFRCLRFGRICDGYDRPNALNFKSQGALVPRSANLEHSSVPFSFSSRYFEVSPAEHEYFRYFRDNTVFELSGGFDTAIWNRIVLQTSHSSPAIHNLLLSISALSRSHALKSNINIAAKTPSESPMTHDSFAFQSYGKALKGIQAIAQNPGPDTRRFILVASILIYAFESLQGETTGDMAVANLKSALSVTFSVDRTRPIVYQHLHPSITHREDVEDELVTALARLDGSLVHRVQSHDPGCTSILGFQLDYYNEEFSIPTRFCDAETARKFLEQLQFRARPNVPSKAVVRSPTPFAPEVKTDRVITVAELEVFREELAHWFIAFQPLMEFARSPEGESEWFPVTTLLVQGLQAHLLLSLNLGLLTEGTTPKLPSDKSLQTCREILVRARELVADRRFVRGFTFDLGIIPSLLSACVASQDVNLGWEIVSLLREIVPRREATFDAAVVADMCQDVMARREVEMMTQKLAIIEKA